MHAATQYFLSAQSYCCELDGGAIILDLEAGSYLGIDADNLPDLRSVICNWPTTQRSAFMSAHTHGVGARELIENLVARGILTQTAMPKRSVCLEKPSSAAENISIRKLTWQLPLQHLPSFLVALATVRARNKDRDLKTLLAKLSDRQSSIHHRRDITSLQQSTATIDAFLRLRIWFYTAESHCLFDSLVLAIFLTRRQIQCTFIIGVSTKPFLAHSWVQIGNLVLNDTPEHVDTFTPILTIGKST